VLATGCPHISERRTELGCYTTAVEIIGELPQLPLYWHLDNYPTRAAAEAAKQARGTVVESLGKVWLFTIADADWRPAGGERTAKIGPLPLSSDGRFTATYLEAITLPGFQTIVHRHPGPEALYMVSGQVCVETPQGKTVGEAGGQAVILAGNEPMRLTDTGAEKRRSLVLVLHDSSQSAIIPASDWTPTGLCNR